MSAALVPDGLAAAIDRTMAAAWFVAAALAWRLVAATTPARRGALYLIAAATTLCAVDKVADLQVAVYGALQAMARGLRELQLGDLVGPLRLALFAGGTLAGLAVVTWLLRRDRHLDRGKAIAAVGIGLVIALVGLRLVPALGFLANQAVGWTVEATALLLLGAGLRHGFARAQLERRAGSATGDDPAHHRG